MSKFLIIGYGNPLRGDDGLGWQAVERLSDLYKEGGVRCMRCHQLTPELAVPISEAEQVAFIDAAHGREPGHIRQEELDPAPSGPVVWGHVMSPNTLLTYSKHLYGACPKARIFSVGAESFEIGERISDRVAAAIPTLIWLIQQWLGKPTKEVA